MSATSFWSQHRIQTISLFVTIALALAVLIFLYSVRFDHPMIYYSGVSPEAPGGRATSVFNPLRRRKDETTATSLISALETEKCEEIVRVRLRANPAQVCAVMRASPTASLIWLDEDRVDYSSGRLPRRVIYDLPEAKARLVIYFRNSEVGWGVDTVAVRR